MNLQNVADRVWDITNDTDSAARRNETAEVARWFSDALDVAARIVPQYFIATGTHTCTAGATQTLSQTRFVSLLPETMTASAGVVNLVSKEALEEFLPTWQAATPAAPTDWMPHPTSTKFYVYPPAVGGEVLTLRFLQAPAEYTDADLATEVALPDAFLPAIVDYVVYRCEHKDDEHVVSQRAAESLAQALAQLKGA